MKNLVLALFCAITLCGGINMAAAAEQKAAVEKPKFEEGTMRKFAVGNTTVQLQKGTVWIYNYGDIKLHAYETKDTFGSFVYLLEKNGQAVLLESPPIKDNYAEWIDYITGLGDKNIDLIVSYHPVGATFIDTDKLTFRNVYSMKNAVDFYTVGAGVPSLAQLKKRNELFDESVYKPTILLKEGAIEIAGITFEMTNADIAFDVAIPEINSVHPHILGHDKHTLVFSYEFLDAYIAQLKRYQDKGYDMFISSHSEPETKGDVTIKLHYLQEMKKIALASSTKQLFIDKMNEAYPGFGWPFYLQGSASFLFKN